MSATHIPTPAWERWAQFHKLYIYIYIYKNDINEETEKMIITPWVEYTLPQCMCPL